MFIRAENKNIMLRVMLLTLMVLPLNACSYTQNKNKIMDASGIEISDPYENLNRKVTSFNTSVDNIFVNPTIRGYRAIAPKPARQGIRNFLRNLRTPINLANQLLQGNLEGAGKTTVRGIINTSLGLGGFIDVAGHEGIEYELEDFGQTLAVWGVPHGPYFVVPFIGPSSMRDYTGFFVDSVSDPVGWALTSNDQYALSIGKFGMDYLDVRESFYDILQDQQSTSIDYYAALRSIYYQNRRAMVHNNNPSAQQNDLPEIPDFDYEEDF